MLFKDFFSAVIQFFVQNIRRNELRFEERKNKGTLFLSLKFGMFSRGRIGSLALSQVGMLNILRVCVRVRKYHSQLKEYHELCFVFSRARVLALNCTISHQMLQGFLYLFLFKSYLH